MRSSYQRRLAYKVAYTQRRNDDHRQSHRVTHNLYEGSDEAEPVDFDDAVKLGLEALKRIQRQRRLALPGEIELLSGETKEQ